MKSEKLQQHSGPKQWIWLFLVFVVLDVQICEPRGENAAIASTEKGYLKMRLYASLAIMKDESSLDFLKQDLVL